MSHLSASPIPENKSCSLFDCDDQRKRSARTSDASWNCSTRRNSVQHGITPIPTLARLCLIRVRQLRTRLEGLPFLPKDIIVSIIEGCTSDELKLIETGNPDAPQLEFWDTFWRPLCEKAMSPATVAAKPQNITWREYFLQIEQETKDKFKLNTLQSKRAGMVVLEDTPRNTSSAAKLFDKRSRTSWPTSKVSHRTMPPGSVPQTSRSPKVRLSNPAIQRSRKFPTSKLPSKGW